MVEKATVTETIDLNYKNGYVQCDCGWFKELGDGFNGYKINCCPTCNQKLATRTQNQVTVGRIYSTTTHYGTFKYFVMSNGIHVQFYRNVLYSR